MYNNDAESYNIVPRVRVSESQSVGEDLKLHSALDFLHGRLVTSRGQMWWVMSPQTTPHSSRRDMTFIANIMWAMGGRPMQGLTSHVHENIESGWQALHSYDLQEI